MNVYVIKVLYCGLSACVAIWPPLLLLSLCVLAYVVSVTIVQFGPNTNSTSKMPISSESEITHVRAYDIRFPTSIFLDGSDAIHKDPDYSCAYVVIHTSDKAHKGYGLTFTCGRGTEVVVQAVHSMAYLLEGRSVKEVFSNMGDMFHSLTQESQFRWLGAEKGATHLATGAIVNAVWDLWARIEGLPVWRLIGSLDAQTLVDCIPFKYIEDAITKEEALELVKRNKATQAKREAELIKDGLPAYLTSVGWLGYDDAKVQRLSKEAMAQGWRHFKMKVGVSVEDDRRRAKIIRDAIGPDCTLGMDANQVWDVKQATAWMKQLAEFKPYWIEEPTSPDDILAHAAIAEAMKPLGILVATGEHCQNRVMFKQFLASGAMQVCQLDSCRVGGVSECLAIMLLAAKFKVPVCPHAGGVGLCEMVQHLAAINYLLFSPSFENVRVEYADHLHEHFDPGLKTSNGRYVLQPDVAGYAKMREKSLRDHIYPHGAVWKELIATGKHEVKLRVKHNDQL